MADSLNNFFNTATGRLGDLTGNPRAEKKSKQDHLFTKTDGERSDLNTHPMQLMEERPVLGARLQQAGFTPVNYYRVRRFYDNNGKVQILPFSGKLNKDGNYEDEIFLNPPEGVRTTGEFFDGNAKTWNTLDVNQKDFKFSLQDFVKYNSQKNSIETSDGGNSPSSWEPFIDKNPLRVDRYLTSYDNEDPVYFGFEVIIDVLNSPLLNGELEKFIDKIGIDYDEVGYRKDIINQFKII